MKSLGKKKINIHYNNLIIALLLVSLTILVILVFIKVRATLNDTLGRGDKAEVEVVDSMDVYGYSLTANNTEYFKSLYYDLKELLEDKNKDSNFNESYAKLVVQLFLTDFYDLNSKINKNDVGGVQFIYEPYHKNFIKEASDINGIYHYVENNVYKDRTQKLPIVESVEINSIQTTTYSLDKLEDSIAYKVTATISYKEDLGYDKSITLILVTNGKKIEIVEMN